MPKKTSSKQDYEQIGRALAAVYESGYLDKRQAYKTSFFKGIFSGLGGVIGATIVVALLVWILSFFNNVPLVGRFVDKIDQSINSAKN